MLLLGLIRLHVTPEVNAIATGVTTITLITFGLAAVIVSLRGAVGVRTEPIEQAIAEDPT